MRTTISQRDNLLAYFLGFISVCAFAATLPLAKNLVIHLSGFEIGIYRSFIASVFALPIIMVFKSSIPNFSQIKRLYLTSIGIIYGFPILTAVGMQYVPVSHGGVVLAALPLCTSVWAGIFTGKKQSKIFWLSSIVGFCIVLIFVIYQNGRLIFHWGDIALIMAAILAGMGYAQGGALSSEMKGWEVMCWTLCLNLPILLVISLFIFKPSHLALSENGWFSLIFLALVNSLIGFFSWNKALALGGIAKISQLQLLQVFITYIYAVVFFNETWNYITVIFFSLVIICVIVSKK